MFFLDIVITGTVNLDKGS